MLINSLIKSKGVFYLIITVLFFTFFINASQKEKDSSNENTKGYRALVLEAAASLENDQVQQGMKQLQDIFPNELQEVIIKYAAGYPKYVFFAKLIGHERGISNMRMLPNGLLSSDSYENIVCAWDSSKFSSKSPNNIDARVALTNGKLIEKHSPAVLSNGFHYFVEPNCTVRVWDPKISTTPVYNKKPSVVILKGHKYLVSTVYELANGLLCTGSYDKTIRIWDPAKFSVTSPDNQDACIAILENNKCHVFCLCELPNGMLAAGLGNGEIIIYKPIPSQLELVWGMNLKCSEYAQGISHLAQTLALNSIFGKTTSMPHQFATGLIRYNLLLKNKNITSKQVDQKDKKEDQA